jgi:hypothetical protein
MNFRLYIPGILCLIAALIILFRLMHYAPFYAPSYFFWIGVILVLAGIISFIKPLAFLFIFDRTIATSVICAGLLISVTSLYWPVPIYHSTTNQKIDTLLHDYSFNEYHEVLINASVEEVKHALHTTSVADIPAALFLMRIRGIANDKDQRDKAPKNKPCTDTLSTPEFRFIVADPNEFITVMIIKASAKIPPPEIKTAEQFRAFNEPGYVKVAINFRLISLDDKQTLLTTETRNLPITQKDCFIFGRYWRIIYPGSAIIRRVWLDVLAQKAEKSEQIKH